MLPLSKSPDITPSSGWHSRPKKTCSNGGSQDYREERRKNHLFLCKITKISPYMPFGVTIKVNVVLLSNHGFAFQLIVIDNA
ncbi:hypothetical protein EXA13_15010 [Vibrio cincinnatiensis]|nr:hypothetical protein [Vibrio cincinnatiensis]